MDGEVISEGTRVVVREPWSGAALAEIVLADAALADRAASAAVRAFEITRRSATHLRRELLRGVAQRIAVERDAFAELLAREAGKPIAQARAEVARAVSTFELASDEVSRALGEVVPLDVTPAAAGYRGQWARVPSGPVIAIAPFNFPLNLVAHKVAPALAVGASVVLKPPPQAPLSSLRLARVVREVGEPLGVPAAALQVIPCEVPVAEALVKDVRFRVFSFTGSDRVGWHLRDVAGKKRTLLELGGNAAAIVHDDAPLERAADRITAGAFGYAGQVCIKVQRAIVHEAVLDRFLAMLIARARAVTPMDPLDPSAVMSAMIDEANATRVESWVDEARAAGVTVAVGGARDRNRYPATVLALSRGQGVGLRVVDEEVFGPVLVVQSYATWDEALTLAGQTRFGLQCGIFTDSVARVRAAYDRLEVGGLVVGDIPTFRVDNMPYGGVRDSGLGREGVRFAMEEMTEPKLLVWAPTA